MSTRCLLALALATALLAAGCSDGQITKTEGDVRIWLHESGFATGADAAEVVGTMEYHRDSRCMYLARGGRLHAVIWPSGTTIEGGDPVVVRSRGETIREGDTVEGGGGFYSFERFEDLIPSECRTGIADGDGVAVFNADSEIEVSQP